MMLLSSSPGHALLLSAIYQTTPVSMPAVELFHSRDECAASVQVLTRHGTDCIDQCQQVPQRLHPVQPLQQQQTQHPPAPLQPQLKLGVLPPIPSTLLAQLAALRHAPDAFGHTALQAAFCCNSSSGTSQYTGRMLTPIEDVSCAGNLLECLSDLFEQL